MPKLRVAVVAVAISIVWTPAVAQQHPQATPLAVLTAQGFEVKAAGGRDGTLLFLQKGKEVFFCTIFSAMLGPNHEPTPCYPIR